MDDETATVWHFDEVTRRVLVQRLAFWGGGVVVLSGCPKKSENELVDSGARVTALTSSHRSFTNPEWDTLTAVVDRIIPKDEDPGALDAHVPDYIDAMLMTDAMSDMKKNFIPGLAALERRAQRMFQKPFPQCTPPQQDELLTLFKESPEKSGEARWYEMLLVLVLEGFLGDPSYGGNRGEVGWKLVGFNLVGRNIKGDPSAGYDGSKHLHQQLCGGGKGC